LLYMICDGGFYMMVPKKYYNFYAWAFCISNVYVCRNSF
jgi:hypothetical protein